MELSLLPSGMGYCIDLLGLSILALSSLENLSYVRLPYLRGYLSSAHFSVLQSLGASRVVPASSGGSVRKWNAGESQRMGSSIHGPWLWACQEGEYGKNVL